MVTLNLNDTNLGGSASTPNGEFLTFDGLANNKFSLIIPSAPNVQFFLQSFTFPTVHMGILDIPTPFLDYTGIGEKLVYDDASLTFLVDKYSRNWASVFNQMKAITAHGSNIGFKENMTLLIDNEPFLMFSGASPRSLSGYDLKSTEEGLVYVKATLVINYDYFDYVGRFKTPDSSY